MLMKDRQMVDPNPVFSCWMICCWYLITKKVPAAVKPTMPGQMMIRSKACESTRMLA